MPKFQIEVIRIGYALREIEVEADTRQEADRKALDEAPSCLFSEHHSEYKLNEG